MKHIVVIFLLFLFIASCEKEEFSNGFATAEFNGKPWKGEAFAKELGEDRIGLNFVVRKKGIETESMGFQFLLKRIGNYMVDFISTDTLFISLYSTTSDDGDVTKDLYYLEKTNLSNSILIDKLTETEIKGTFDLTFMIDTTRIKQDLEAPDVIHFINGEFHSKINK